MAWIILYLAGALEIVWAGAMKASDGFSKPGWTALTAAAAALSFWLLALAMKDLPLGTAYAVWVGIGAVGAFIIGVMFMGEALSPLRVASVGLIIAGLVGLKLSTGGRNMSASEKIALVRSVLLGVTGLVCVLYAVLAAAQGRPDPMPWYVPGAFGLVSSAVITASFLRAGPRAIRAATDELHHTINAMAQRQAYWVSLAAFVVVSVLAANGVINHDTGFAIIGTLMGAAYLLLFVFHEWRMG